MHRYKIPLLKIIFTVLLSLVWLINGLFCKVLNMVPRHQLIVERILGADNGFLFTKLIGITEICMFIWIISRIKPRWCAIVQMVIVATMNTIEFIVAPDLLLFHRVNAIFATMLMITIFVNEFVIPNKKKTLPTN